ncbi:pirin-like C-terminal cupin domain-containing protein [Pseudobacillus sp. FSL P4-0506]|uniref:pirin family protein n=1 Tax=unclassified Pseudobacillus TaxID=2619284 RepID=UPI0030FABE92
MRSILDSWKVKFNERGFPHIQQAFVLPPEKMHELDPFIMLAEDWFKRGTFADHPHKGFQTVTYVMDGRLEHIDNKGGRGILGPGDVQYMNAGAGARHAEEAVDDDIVHSLQLWLNLPAKLKNSTPFYQDIYAEDVPVKKVGSAMVRVFAGDGGPMKPLIPFSMAEILLPAKETYIHELPVDDTAFIYVLAGRAAFGETSVILEQGYAATLTKGSSFRVESAERTKVLIYSGQAQGDPIVSYGPFVMNSREEIRQALQDFQEGKFGPEAK